MTVRMVAVKSAVAKPNDAEGSHMSGAFGTGSQQYRRLEIE